MSRMGVAGVEDLNGFPAYVFPSCSSPSRLDLLTVAAIPVVRLVWDGYDLALETSYESARRSRVISRLFCGIMIAYQHH